MLNPPYGEVHAFMKKAFEQSLLGATVVCLVPARTDTEWWFQYARKGLILFLKGRLKFGGGENSAPFPSALIIFFGGSVPRRIVDQAWAMLDRAEVLLVAGSSLTVFSGFRFVRRAAQQKLPIAIVNLGPTRGDDLANLCIKQACGKSLSDLARELLS